MFLTENLVQGTGTHSIGEWRRLLIAGVQIDLSVHLTHPGSSGPSVPT